jgi:hypothetical protein
VLACSLHTLPSQGYCDNSCPLPSLLQKQLASIEPAYYLNYGEAIAATTDPSMQVMEEVKVVEVVEEAVELVKVAEEPFSWKFTSDWITKSNYQKPPTSTDCSLWIEVHYSGSSAAADDGLPYSRVALPQPDFSEGAQWGYYGALMSAAEGK